MPAQKRQPLISRVSRRRKLSVLTHNLAPASRILEVGSGEGWFAQRLKEKGHQVVTIDLGPPADVVGDILKWRELPLEEASFDAVIALEVIEHVECLQELKDLCRPGGLILLSSPHPQWDWAMKVLERLHLNQRRTSPHSNLTDFARIELQRVVFQRPMVIHQVALFRNQAT